MKRPSFQFYPADWKGNANLRRCSKAARGDWMDILCVLHDSDQYGVVRWPLADLVNAAGADMKLVRELVSKGVLKGAESGPVFFAHTPRHAGKDGEPVTLIEGNGPIWFSSRMVTDEWRRKVSGGKTRFGTTTPDTTPRHGDPQGTDLGDGATTSSSSSSSTVEPSGSTVLAKDKGKSRRGLQDGFPDPSDLTWAREHWLKKGRVDLCNGINEEIEKFRDHHTGKATKSADWPGSWRTWCRNAMTFNPKPNGPGHGKRSDQPTAHDKFFAGGAAYIRELLEPGGSPESGANDGDPDAPGGDVLPPRLLRSAG